MKRGLLGVIILLVLLGSGAVISWSMRTVHQDISLLLEQAADAAGQDNWQQAGKLARQAKNQWQQHHKFTAAFADHTPMDELDKLFAELTVFLDNRESPHFEATCLQLALLAQSMADSHGLQWWNLL